VAGTIQGCDEYDFGGGYLNEYADVIKTIGTEYQVEVLDNYYEMGINKENLSQYTEDNIHLNEAGRELLAKRLAEKIKDL
jgi:lysophospholipase L1-like esterase